MNNFILEITTTHLLEFYFVHFHIDISHYCNIIVFLITKMQ